MRCRCRNEQRFYSAHCPDKATHVPWETLESYSDPTMRDAAAYHEEWKGRSLSWTPFTLQPKPKPIGVTVPIEEHISAFARKWEKFVDTHEKYIEPQPSKPLITSRPALPEEIPNTAAACIELANARGATVWTEFSQGGEWRETGPRCVCPTCDAHVGAAEVEYGEDGTRTVCEAHSGPIATCPASGAGLDPSGPESLTCPLCGASVRRLKRTNTVSKHNAKPSPCVGGEKEPKEVIPSKPVPPVCSLLVKIKGTGVAVYEDGKFKFAYVIVERVLTKVGAKEWKVRCQSG